MSEREPSMSCNTWSVVVCSKVTISSSSTPNGEIGSKYPSNVSDCKRLSLPCVVMFIDLLDGRCNEDQNSWNTFPVLGQKKILSSNIKQSDKQNKRTNREQNEFKITEQNDRPRIRSNE